jgi:hypothetical protein
MTRVRPGRAIVTPTRLYLVAFVVTNIGVGGFALATGMALFAATGSAGTFSALVATEYALGFIGQFVGGSILDRLDVLRVAVWSNGLRSTVVLLAGGVGLLAAGRTLLIGAFLLSGFIRPLYRSASFALVPRVCPPEDLPRVNGLRFGLLQVAQIGGLLVVAGLITVLPSAGVVFTVGCFFLAGTLIMSRLRTLPRAAFTTPGGDASDRSDNAAAAVWSRIQPVRHRRPPLALVRTWREVATVFRSVPSVCVHLAVACVAPVVVSLASILVVPVNTALHGGPLGIALLDGGVTIGSLVAVIAIRRTGRPQYLPGIGLGITAIVGALATLSLARHILLAAVAFFLVGLGSAGAASLLDTLLQLRTAPELIGRLSVCQEFMVSVSALLMLPYSGTAVARWGFQPTAAAFALIVSLYLAVLLVAGLRLRGDLFGRRLSLQPDVLLRGIR